MALAVAVVLCVPKDCRYAVAEGDVGIEVHSDEAPEETSGKSYIHYNFSPKNACYFLF